MKIKLTDNELQVLNLVKIGDSNQEIAAKLSTSLGGVKSCIRSMMLKLNAKNRVQMILEAVRLQIIDLSLEQ